MNKDRAKVKIAEQMRLPRTQQRLSFRAFAGLLAAIFSFGVRLRSMAFACRWRVVHRLPGCTLSVGNITVGGTGKSPVVQWLASVLIAEGARPAILTRGYGSGLATDDSLALLAGVMIMPPLARNRRVKTATEEHLPDEGRMQSVSLPTVPIVVGARRYEAAIRFLAAHPEQAPTHWLLDDGFQHRQLHRDVDIVLLDADEPWGNGCFLPAGILREAPSSLSRAQAVLLTRVSEDKAYVDLMQQIRALGVKLVASVKFGHAEPIYATGASSGEGSRAEPLAFNPRSHAPVLLVSGIARPDRLRSDLESLGTSVASVIAVSDHAALVRADIEAALMTNASAVMTTAKDYWRDPSVFEGLPKPVFILPLTVGVDADTRTKLIELVRGVNCDPEVISTKD